MIIVTRKYTLLLLFIFLVLSVVLLVTHQRNRADVTVRFLDVGQGDATLISHGHTQLLIDGGPGDTILQRLDHALPFGDRVIEYAVLSHPHADHYRGICLLGNNFTIKRLYVTTLTTTNPEYSSCIERLSKTTEIHVVSSAQEIGDKELRLQILYPNEPLATKAYSDPNNASIIALYSYGPTKILFPGDAEAEEEKQVQGLPIKADILKVPHHGSATSSTAEFLEVVRPRFCAISLGANNRYHHPAPKTVHALEAEGCQVRRTDQNGTITVSLTKQGYSAQTERR